MNKLGLAEIHTFPFGATQSGWQKELQESLPNGCAFINAFVVVPSRITSNRAIHFSADSLRNHSAVNPISVYFVYGQIQFYVVSSISLGKRSEIALFDRLYPTTNELVTFRSPRIQAFQYSYV